MDQLAATKLELDHYLKRYKPRKVKTFQLRKEQLKLSCRERVGKIQYSAWQAVTLRTKKSSFIVKVHASTFNMGVPCGS